MEIEPQDIFHLMHYESILCEWWAYKSSLRFRKPELMPNLAELTKDGKQFQFRRFESLDNAFSNKEFGVSNQSAKTAKVAVATKGGEELMSARFLKNDELG